MSETALHSDRRARWISGTAFALAAALAALAGLAVGWWSAPDRGVDATVVLAPLVWAVPAGLVGVVAGRRLAAASSGARAMLWGVGVTLASAGLVLLLLYGVEAASDPARAGAVLGELLVPGVWILTLVLALVVSPVGALAAWLAWRRIHRGGGDSS